MCLITEQITPIILEKDLVVYKQIIRKNRNIVFSNFCEFEYKLGKLYQTDIEYSDNRSPYDSTASEYYYSDTMIGKPLQSYGIGFHSVLSKERFRFVSKFDKNDRIVSCTIPKGSEVYYDKTGLVISNQIVINKILKKD